MLWYEAEIETYWEKSYLELFGRLFLAMPLKAHRVMANWTLSCQVLMWITLILIKHSGDLLFLLLILKGLQF